MKYRIKELKNSRINKSKFKLQVKCLWWWNDCYRALGWGCDEVVITDTRGECELEQLKQEIDNSWGE